MARVNIRAKGSRSQHNVAINVQVSTIVITFRRLQKLFDNLCDHWKNNRKSCLTKYGNPLKLRILIGSDFECACAVGLWK